jgi:hypothetical protein
VQGRRSRPRFILPPATGKSRASFRWIPLSTISLAASASLCFAQEHQTTSHESAARVAAIIAAVSAVAAVIAAVVASRSALAAMKSARAMMSAQKTYGRTLPPPITITVNKKLDWARNFIAVIDTPFGTVLAILFSIAVGLGLVSSCPEVLIRGP